MVRFCIKEFDLKLILIFLEMEDLPDEEINTLMRKHFSSIRTFYKKGKVQFIFNFYYNEDLKLLIRKIANQILKFQFNRFKINYSFGYILKNVNNNDLRYYLASFNNSVMMSTARLISNRHELIEFLNTLAEESFYVWSFMFFFYVCWPKNLLIGSVVEWLKHRTDDQHGLGSKPTCTILLCPWERHFTALSPAWWS